MKTPYDAILRVRQREMDALRSAITTQMNEITQIEHAQIEVDTALHHAQDVAAQDIVLHSAAYMTRMRNQRRHLHQKQVDAGIALGHLRGQAMQAFGEMKTIATAADGFRVEAERTISNAEQSGIDDFTAAGFVQRMAVARKARTL